MKDPQLRHERKEQSDGQTDTNDDSEVERTEQLMDDFPCQSIKGMNDMAATDTISKGIGDSGAEGHDMRHKRGTKQKRMEGYSRV